MSLSGSICPHNIKPFATREFCNWAILASSARTPFPFRSLAYANANNANNRFKSAQVDQLLDEIFLRSFSSFWKIPSLGNSFLLLVSSTRVFEVLVKVVGFKTEGLSMFRQGWPKVMIHDVRSTCMYSETIILVTKFCT